MSKRTKETILVQLNEDNKQFTLLQHMIDDNKENEALTELVLDKMAENKFRLGMDAKDFFFACADQIFFENQKKYPLSPGEDVNERMKKLHPLWGKSYMSY